MFPLFMLVDLLVTMNTELCFKNVFWTELHNRALSVKTCVTFC